MHLRSASLIREIILWTASGLRLLRKANVGEADAVHVVFIQQCPLFFPQLTEAMFERLLTLERRLGEQILCLFSQLEHQLIVEHKLAPTCRISPVGEDFKSRLSGMPTP